MSGDGSPRDRPPFRGPLPFLPLPGSRGAFPRPTSPYAAWALLLGLLAIVCIGPGPLLGAVAIALGVLGHREIVEGKGHLGGRALATAGIVLGVLSFGVFGGLLALYMHHTRSPASARPTYATVASPPASTGSSATASDGSATIPQDPSGPPLPTISTIAQIGNITVIDVAPGVVSLSKELQDQRTAAAAHEQKLVLETVRASCEPCDGVAQALGDARMQKALAGVRLVRIDRDQFQEDLHELKIPSDKVPGFFLIDSDLRVKDAVFGDEWDDDQAGNIAPVLGPFVRGTYTRRRTPWKAPRPSGTVM